MSFSRSLRFLYSDRLRLPLGVIFFLMILLSCWITWFSMIKIPLYSVTDQARLEVDQASCPVQTTIDGKIIGISMKLDQKIEKGAVLVRFDDQSLQLKKNEILDQIVSLSAQVSALEEQIVHEQDLIKEQGQISLIKLQEAKSQQREKEVSAKLAEEEAKRLGKLHSQGALTEMKLLEVQAEAEKGRALAEAIRISLDRLAGEDRLEEKEGQTHLSQLKQELIEIKRDIQNNQALIEQIECEIEKHKVRAPVSGRIAETSDLHQGMFIEQGNNLATILPGGHLKAVAFFPPFEAMGKIFPGQKASLRLKGFPWLQYSKLAAKVEKVSREVRDGQVRVDLALLTPERLSMTLQHGLPARVEIETERVTPAVLVLRKAGKFL